MQITQPLTVYLPDSRGVEVSRYGKGNLKIGPDVYTYSRRAGRGATCPGATEWCESVCYAKRIDGVVHENYFRNRGDDVPPIPVDCKLLRIHVSGDFDTVAYIESWIAELTRRPDVRAWAYTRSWRVPELVEALERLQLVPNMQLFASMEHLGDLSLSPPPWRLAWIAPKGSNPPRRHGVLCDDPVPYVTRSIVCPEELGVTPNCQACTYCFQAKRQDDVTFLEH